MMEAGADSCVELGFTLADGIEYLRTAQRRGLDLLSVYTLLLINIVIIVVLLLLSNTCCVYIRCYY